MATAPTGPTAPAETATPKPEAPVSGKIPFANLTYVSSVALSTNADKSPVVVRISDLDEESLATVKKEYEDS